MTNKGLIDISHLDLSKSSNEEKILIYAYVDLMVFGKSFLAFDFKKKPSGEFQQTMLDEINSSSTKPTAIIIARGHAKTTTIKCSVVHDMCYHKKAMENFARMASTEQIRDFWLEQATNWKPKLYGWVAKSQDDSQNNVRYIAKNLMSNAKILHYFGMGKGFVGDKWTLHDIITAYGDRLISASNIKSIRGFTELDMEHGTLRFYRVFADDFENETNTKTFLAREDLKNTITASIIPAIEPDRPGSRLFLIGTPVHFDSLIQNIIDDFMRIKDDDKKIDEYPWKILYFGGATQPNLPGGVLWPGNYSKELLEKKRREYAVLGREAKYYQEYELQVQSDDESKWTRKHIKYHKGVYKWESNIEQGFLLIEGEWIAVNTFGGIDPATDIDTENADDSVIGVVAVDKFTNVYALEYEAHRNISTLGLRDEQNKIVGKEGIIDIAFKMHDTYHCKKWTIEDVAMNRSVFQSLRTERMRPGSVFNNRWDFVAIPEKPAGKGSKRSRIYSRLNGRFAAGLMHIRETHTKLFDQIIMFGPRMAHDDVIEWLMLATMWTVPPAETAGKNLYDDMVVTMKSKKKRAKSWLVS